MEATHNSDPQNPRCLDSTFFSLAHNATAGKNGDKAATPPRFAGNGQARLVAVQGMFDDGQAKAGATRFA